MVHFTLCLCLFLISPLLVAAPIYHSIDEYGRSIYSDILPNKPHNKIVIKHPNNYDWHQFDYMPPKKSKKKRKTNRKNKSLPKLSFDQLRANCQAARYKHQNYRGRGGSDDWGKYKSKVIKYAVKRDYWCRRYLRRK